MRIAAGVFTWNPRRNRRVGLLRDVLESLREADRVFLVDNGSDDGSADLIRRMGGYINEGRVTTCGAGMNLTGRILAEHGDADLFVLSNDDVVWHDGWAARLRDVWKQIPDDVVIVSGLLQAEYPWNTARGVEGPVLIRDTVCGGAWTLRSVDYDRVFPVSTVRGWDDVPKCRELAADGLRVGAVDVADHAGEGSSTWGNQSHLWEQASIKAVRERWQV